MSARPLVVGGATGTGKTALAVELAVRCDAELVNADSRQVMRRLRVGTATPTAEELRGVRCHLLDLTEPGVSLAAPDWRDRALEALADIRVRGVPAIVVGGTAQYIRALCEGWMFAGPPPDPVQRRELTAQAASPDGLRRLGEEVCRRDPAGAHLLDLDNPRRVVRAVETLRSGRSLAESRRRNGGLATDIVVLDASRTARNESLDRRMAALFDGDALLDETAAELARGTPAEQLGRAGIGYREAIGVIDGRLTRDQARERTEVATRRYSKSQRTAFRPFDARLRITRESTDTVAALADDVLAVWSRR